MNPHLLPKDSFICGFQVIVGGSGAAQSLAGLRLLLEHLSHTQVFNWLGQMSHTPVLIHQVAPSLLGDEGEGAAVPLSEKIGKK